MKEIPAEPMVLVVMGVSGSGKSTTAEALACRLGWPFKEGDDLHPPANHAKMAAGQALDDADRRPWLDSVAAWIDARLQGGGSGVITCSALKRAYRNRLRQGRPSVRFVFLAGPKAVVQDRMRGRRGHFMPASLLESQFETLEPPGPDEGAIVVDLTAPTEAQVDVVVTALGGGD